MLFRSAAASALGLPAPALASLALLAVLATGLEQLSCYGIDNLSVPLATGLLWSLWS